MASLPFAMASVHHKCVVHVAAATADFSSHCLAAAAARFPSEFELRELIGNRLPDSQFGKNLEKSDLGSVGQIPSPPAGVERYGSVAGVREEYQGSNSGQWPAPGLLALPLSCRRFIILSNRDEMSK
uniref:Uncharacterized protein n=1 Tax=Oryza glumipatula TaxID=40148 RepID=A0A0D9YGV0_9ORYZ